VPELVRGWRKNNWCRDPLWLTKRTEESMTPIHM
jgi:hypothetical protein